MSKEETLTDYSIKYPPKRFEYSLHPYLMILVSGLVVWILLGIIGSSFNTFTSLSAWHTFERLLWWFAFIIVMMYMDRRNSRMALDHNLQNLSTLVREREMLSAIIHYKKKAEGVKRKCSPLKKQKKTTTKSTTKKKSS